MDERQTKIKEGAGLEESRINQDFIDLLKKWSTPVLLILAIITFAYVGYQRIEQARLANVNDAFQLLDNTVSADSLGQIAEDYGDVRAVPHLARLRQGDLYMDSVRRRVRLLAELNQDGSLATEEDALTEEDRAAYLRQARNAYRQVVDGTSGNKSQIMLHVSGLYGLAAVAESEEQWEDARARYQQVVDAVTGTAFESQAEVAAGRIASLEELSQQEVTIYLASNLPSAAPPPSVSPGEQPVDPGTAGPVPPLGAQPGPPTPTSGEGGEPPAGDPASGDPASGDPDPGAGGTGDPGSGDPPL